MGHKRGTHQQIETQQTQSPASLSSSKPFMWFFETTKEKRIDSFRPLADLALQMAFEISFSLSNVELVNLSATTYPAPFPSFI